MAVHANAQRVPVQRTAWAVSRGVPRGFDPSHLEEALAAEGLSVYDLSKMSDLSAGILFKYLRGEHKPQIESIVKISHALGIPIAFLLRIPEGTEDISDLRNLAGLTRREVAAASGLTPAVYSSVEIGLRRLSASELPVVASVLGVSGDALARAWDRARQSPLQKRTHPSGHVRSADGDTGCDV